MSELDRRVRDLVIPGASLRVYYGPNHFANETRHIRAIVDCDYVVYCVWLKRKRFWRYLIDPMFRFELFLKNGELRKVKSKWTMTGTKT